MISSPWRYTLIAICFGLAVYCFMIKLPVPFRKIDKECHALFFFSAAAFLNVLLQIRKPGQHFLVFCILFLFGVLIEFSQDYSNQFFRKRIHGNFDPLDLKYNTTGASLFSVLWCGWYVMQLFGKSKQNSPSK